jgi:hypothetical protein
VCNRIFSYTFIRGHIRIYGLTLLSLLQFQMFRIWDFMNYHFPTRHDTHITREISHRFASTDCISEVSKYVYWIDVNGNRDDLVRIPEANWPETRRNTYEWEIIRTWDLRIADTKEAWIVHPIEVNSSTDNPSWYQRPTGQETRQRPSQSKSIATNSYENSNAINCSINEIW